MIYVLYYLVNEEDEWKVWPNFFETEQDAEEKGFELTGDSSNYFIKET